MRPILRYPLPAAERRKNLAQGVSPGAGVSTLVTEVDRWRLSDLLGLRPLLCGKAAPFRPSPQIILPLFVEAAPPRVGGTASCFEKDLERERTRKGAAFPQSRGQSPSAIAPPNATHKRGRSAEPFRRARGEAHGTLANLDSLMASHRPTLCFVIGGLGVRGGKRQNANRLGAPCGQKRIIVEMEHKGGGIRSDPILKMDEP